MRFTDGAAVLRRPVSGNDEALLGIVSRDLEGAADIGRRPSQ
jgi:hypothetical protein